MNEILFLEDNSNSYSHRTYVNAYNADATIAFAADFLTSGEKCTKRAALQANKIYIPIDIFKDINGVIKDTANKLKDCNSLNIAGNGIATLKRYGVSQEICDEIVFRFLHDLIYNQGCNFTEIRSGGQTGFDESAIKAGIMLGIKTICYCPKGWRFRTIDNVDISSEQEFKKRFF